MLADKSCNMPVRSCEASFASTVLKNDHSSSTQLSFSVLSTNGRKLCSFVWLEVNTSEQQIRGFLANSFPGVNFSIQRIVCIGENCSFKCGCPLSSDIRSSLNDLLSD